MEYKKTKYPNIYTYENESGKFYYIRKTFTLHGQRKERTRSGIKTLPEARAKLLELDKKIQDQTIGIDTEIKVKDYWEIYYDKSMNVGRWTPNSEIYVRGIFKNHILPNFGEIKLKNLSRNLYEEYINKQLQTRPKSTVKTIDSCFMALLNDAVLNGNIPINRLRQVRMSESPIPKRNKKITLEQFNVWMDKAEKIMSKKIFALTYLAMFGLRRGEIFGIRNCDVTFNINNRAILHLRDSRGNHTKNGRHGLKTKSSERYVALDDKGTELIKFLISDVERIKKNHAIIQETEWDYISRNEDGTLINPNQLNKEFEKINSAFNFRVTPHMLRHFFTTQGIIAGIPMEALSQALGHTQSYMTEKYNQVQDELSELVTDTFTSHLRLENTHTFSPRTHKTS